MTDKKTWSAWDHMTGECFQGVHTGKTLATYPVSVTTVKAALHDDPDIMVSLSRFNSLVALVFRFLSRHRINGKGFLPPPFYSTMHGTIDPRMSKLQQGLGVIIDGKGKFYPMDAIPKGGEITDLWRGSELVIRRGGIDGVPHAVYAAPDDSGEFPMQLLSRWYGFSFTFPGCDIYDFEDSTNRRL